MGSKNSEKNKRKQQQAEAAAAAKANNAKENEAKKQKVEGKADDSAVTPVGDVLVLSNAVTPETLSSPGMDGVENHAKTQIVAEAKAEVKTEAQTDVVANFDPKQFCLLWGNETYMRKCTTVLVKPVKMEHEDKKLAAKCNADELSDIEDDDDSDDEDSSGPIVAKAITTIKSKGALAQMYVLPLWHGQVSLDGKAVTLLAFSEGSVWNNGRVIPSYGSYVYQSELRWGRAGDLIQNSLKLTLEDTVVLVDNNDNPIRGEEKTGSGGKKYRSVATGFFVHHDKAFASWDDVDEFTKNLAASMRQNMKVGPSKKAFEIESCRMPEQQYKANLSHWISPYDIYRMLSKANEEFKQEAGGWLKNEKNLAIVENLIVPGQCTVEEYCYLGFNRSWLKDAKSKGKARKINKYITQKGATLDAAFEKVMERPTFDKANVDIFTELVSTVSDYWQKKNNKTSYDAKGNKIA